MKLRDYQQAVIDDARNFIDDGLRRIIIHSGTGTGKTVIAAAITNSAIQLGHHVLFLAHRRELIDQAYRKLAGLGLECSVIMAKDKRYAPWAKVHVASVATLVNRQHPPKAMLIIIDECHRAPAETYQRILAMYPDSVVIGLTATPCRTDSKGLGDMFQVIASCPSVGHMMRTIDPDTGRPYLVSTRVFAPPSADLTGVKVQNGDYQQGQLAAVCDKPKLIGSIVEHWQKHAAGRRTIVFAAGVEHSRHIVDEFVAAGVKAEHLDGTTDTVLRAEILARLHSGETTLVSNVGVLTEGFDEPAVSCIVLACPTKSLVKYLQMVGRALRPFPDKPDCLVMDHASATAAHGFVDDDRVWSLTTTPQLASDDPENKAPTMAICNQAWIDTATGETKWPCYACFRAGPEVCPFCGIPLPRKVRKIETEEGELREIVRSEAPPLWEGWGAEIEAAPVVQPPKLTPEQYFQKQVNVGRKIGREKGYSVNWGVHFAQRAFLKFYGYHPDETLVQAARIEDAPPPIRIEAVDPQLQAEDETARQAAVGRLERVIAQMFAGGHVHS